MLDIKLNTIKFLMTMFDSSCGNSTQVRAYKAQVDELVRRNQLSPAIRRLIFSLYGIENTDVFKPNTQSQKLMQVNMLLGMGEMAYKDNRLRAFKGIIDDGVKSGSILKSARDFIFAVFELDTLSGTCPSTSMQDDLSPVSHEVKRRVVSEMLEEDRKVGKVGPTKLQLQSEEVKADIDKIKPEFVELVYYEYDNPHYTGCSGESRTLHSSLQNSVSKPKGAVLVYRKEVGDPCHHTSVYYEIPKSWYKPKPKPVTTTKVVNTPIGDPCSSGGYSRSSC